MLGEKNNFLGIVWKLLLTRLDSSGLWRERRVIPILTGIGRSTGGLAIVISLSVLQTRERGVVFPLHQIWSHLALNTRYEKTKCFRLAKKTKGETKKRISTLCRLMTWTVWTKAGDPGVQTLPILGDNFPPNLVQNMRVFGCYLLSKRKRRRIPTLCRLMSWTVALFFS